MKPLSWMLGNATPASMDVAPALSVISCGGMSLTLPPGWLRHRSVGNDQFSNVELASMSIPVSYTHLTLPTKA